MPQQVKAGSARQPKHPTRDSTPKLSEAARHLVLPQGIVTTGWPSVSATCSRMAIGFDPWQDQAGRAILGKNSEGLYASDAVVLSIPRQVGKTYLIGSIVIALCIKQPRTQAIWTAHHSATSSDTFRDLKALVNQPAVKPYIRQPVYDSGGRQEIIFVNGSSIKAGAREHGFGRGFKKVGILVFDEAQILTSKTIEDMEPTTNRHPNPLIFYMGTPPKPSDPCEHFLMMRQEAIDGESTDTLYLEFSADPDADEMDRAQWAKANPSYPVHTSDRAMLRMKKNLKGAGAFAREALGIWDGTASAGVFSPGSWARCRAQEELPRPEMLGIAADVDQTWLSLGAFGGGHIGPVARMRFDRSRAEFVAEVERVSRKYGILPAIDKRGPAAPLIDDLLDLDIDPIQTGLDDLVHACADIRDAVETQQVRHGGYPELDDAVDAATWRTVGDRRVFVRKAADISMLEAVTLARWAALQVPTYDLLSSIG